MARLGAALGWRHYSAGWHATCTAGAPAAAAGAAVALGLPAERIAAAMALAVPAAGGVQRAFGTDAKSLQVGFAVEAGIRAARLAAAGAQADPSALDVWLGLVGGDTVRGGPVRRIRPYRTGWRSSSTRAATRCSGRSAPCPTFRRPGGGPPDRAADPGGRTVVPLIHHRPQDAAGRTRGYRASSAWSTRPRPRCWTPGTRVRQLHRRGRPPGRGPAAGRRGRDQARPGRRLAARRRARSRGAHRRRDGAADPPAVPAGFPARPPTPDQLAAKLADCVAGLDTDPAEWTWENAAETLRRWLPCQTN